MDHNITYKIAFTDADFEQGKNLFNKYAASLGVDLSFQDFEHELQVMRIQYNKPHGALLLALSSQHAIGCTGIRMLDTETAELKRMYVQDEFRGKEIGKQLLERSIIIAKGLGYKKIRLDTLKNMVKAQRLYLAFGFYQIPPYCFNPLEGTMYMEKKL